MHEAACSAEGRIKAMADSFLISRGHLSKRLISDGAITACPSAASGCGQLC